VEGVSSPDWDSLWQKGHLVSHVGLDDFQNLHRQDDNGEPEVLSDFGENIFGIKSMTDLKDFIAAQDANFKALHDAVLNTPPSSPPWPPGAYAAGYKDYQALISKWQPARTAAVTAISMSWGDPNLQTGQPFYDTLLHIVQPLPLTTSSGDLVDLNQRLNAIQPIPAYSVPQPTKGADQQMALSQVLAPFDPIGNAKAAENWKKDAILAGTVLVGLMFLATLVAKKIP
jgi:hypothetical protein